MEALELLKLTLIGKMARANHPITCLNPSPTFQIQDVRMDEEAVVSVIGENTCWFGRNMWTLVE